MSSVSPLPYDICPNNDQAAWYHMINSLVNFVTATTHFAASIRTAPQHQEQAADPNPTEEVSLADFLWFLKMLNPSASQENLQKVQEIPLIQWPVETPHGEPSMEPRSFSLIDTTDTGDARVVQDQSSKDSCYFQEYSDSEQTIDSSNLQENFEVSQAKSAEELKTQSPNNREENMLMVKDILLESLNNALQSKHIIDGTLPRKNEAAEKSCKLIPNKNKGEKNVITKMARRPKDVNAVKDDHIEVKQSKKNPKLNIDSADVKISNTPLLNKKQSLKSNSAVEAKKEMITDPNNPKNKQTLLKPRTSKKYAGIASVVKALISGEVKTVDKNDTRSPPVETEQSRNTTLNQGKGKLSNRLQNMKQVVGKIPAKKSPPPAKDEIKSCLKPLEKTDVSCPKSFSIQDTPNIKVSLAKRPGTSVRIKTFETSPKTVDLNRVELKLNATETLKKAAELLKTAEKAQKLKETVFKQKKPVTKRKM